MAAGPDHVRRAAALVQSALDGTAGRGIAMGALPYDGSCDAVIRLPERVVRGESSCTPASLRSRTGRSHRSFPIRCRSSTRPRWSAHWRRSTPVWSRRWCWREPCWWRRIVRSMRVSSRDASTPRNREHSCSSSRSRVAHRTWSAPHRNSSSGAGARKVFSDPLAGTARRSRDRTRDREIAQQLLDAVKEQREHRLVAEAVADALAPFCSKLVVDSEASVTSTATLWHLHTAIKGTLKPDAPDALTIAAALHPTPAVCGTPQAGCRRTHRPSRAVRPAFLRRPGRLGRRTR